MFVAEPVNEVEIDVIGAQGGEPLVNHPEHLGGPTHHVLGDEKDLLANLGSLVEPLLEERLGTIDLGGSKTRHTAWYESRMIRSKPEPRTVPCSSMVTCTPVLPRVRLGISTGLVGRSGEAAGIEPIAAAVASRGLKERTTIGTGRFLFRHQLTLLDESKTYGDSLGGAGPTLPEIFIASRAAYPRVRCAMRYYDLQQPAAASPVLKRVMSPARRKRRDYFVAWLRLWAARIAAASTWSSLGSPMMESSSGASSPPSAAGLAAMRVLTGMSG